MYVYMYIMCLFCFVVRKEETNKSKEQNKTTRTKHPTNKQRNKQQRAPLCRVIFTSYFHTIPFSLFFKTNLTDSNQGDLLLFLGSNSTSLCRVTTDERFLALLHRTAHQPTTHQHTNTHTSVLPNSQPPQNEHTIHIAATEEGTRSISRYLICVCVFCLFVFVVCFFD